MVFSSLFFLYVFFPLNLLCYKLAKGLRAKNTVMLIFSLIFYTWGEPVYVLLLLGMAFADYLLALFIGRQSPKGALAKLGIVLTCLVDLGLLGIFKYGTFFLENLRVFTGSTDPVVQILLPIGISFYTFQLLSYVIDVYRGEVPAQRRFATLLLYVGLFHQCIAGPIVRYQDVAEQLESRTAGVDDLAAGIRRFTIGLAKKAILANACGQVADRLLVADTFIASDGVEAARALLAARPVLALWVGVFAYAMQIYLDFSAYSDMAIGMGQMIGMRYKENFDYPYISRSVSEFWRRWHISLGSFFRDYVYIPLGGNRCSKGRLVFNLFVVWLLTGFWHGASWNFVFWGLYFFLFLVLERFLIGDWLKENRALSHLYLLLVVYFGWILFRFRDFSMVWLCFKGLFGGNGTPFTSYEVTATVTGFVFVLLFAAVACTPLGKYLARGWKRLSAGPRVAQVCFVTGRVLLPLLLLALSTMALVGNTYNPFLYFQF